MKYMMKPGRCANGAQLDAGTLVHAVETDHEWGYMGAALCGTVPGRRTPGWSDTDHTVPTCPRCIKQLAKRSTDQ